LLSGLGEVDVAAEMGDWLLAALFLIHIKTINFREGKIERSELVAVEFVLEGEVDEVADLGEVFVLLY
jgi:hypothetical protein